MFSEIAEIALVAARLGQFLQFLKTRVILILNFTRPHAITNTYITLSLSLPSPLPPQAMLKAPAMILGVKSPSNQHCIGGGGGMREFAVL